VNTKLKHVLANLLVVLLVLEPFSFALAGGITAAPGAPASKQPTIDAAANGVPVVNIVKPNASGLSHNQFDQFNVPSQGVIINNSSSAGVSQLGGAIAGNANFGGGAEARIILNEVTGSSRSRIEGYTEIFGFAAQYILANPNGISVNGGGFINTPKATLTTGAPRFDGAGGLLGLDVRRGDVLIEGQGLNAGNLDAFEIVSRTAKINAELHARNLSIIAGQGSYDPATGQSTPLAPDGSAAPIFALDSTALGGMYAQRIKLVGTEAGVGVNLGGTVRSTDQLTLTADGKIQLAGAVSSDKDAAVASRSGSVEISGKLGTGGTAGVEAAQELRLATLAGGDAPLLYGENVNITAKTLHNVDGQMLANAAFAATVSADAANSGTIYSGSGLTLATTGALRNAGQVLAKNSLDITTTGRIENSGKVQSGGTASVRSAGDIDNAGGEILAQGGMVLEAAGNVANTGSINTNGLASISAGGILSNTGGSISSHGDLELVATGSLSNTGAISSGASSTVRSAGDIDNAGGEILAQGGMALEATGNVVNTGSINTTGLASISAGGILSNTGGSISSHGDLELVATGSLSNTGTIYSGASGIVRTPSLLNSSTGQILALGNLLFENAASLENRGLLRTGQVATMTTGGFSNQGGQILAQSGIALNASADVENTGTLNSGGFGAYRTTGLLRNTGSFLTQGDATFSSAGDFVNTGILQFGGRLEYVLGGNLLNTGGQILVTGDSLLAANGDLTNTGLLFTGGTATYAVGGTLLNNRGQMLSLGDMLLRGAAPGTRMLKLQNDSGLIESLHGSIGIKADSVLNNNLDFSLEEGAIPGTTLEGGLHSYGNDGWGVGPIFTWATGHGTTPGLFTWNSCRIYLDYVNALGLDAARNVFSLAELTAAVNVAELELQSAPNAARQTKVNWVKSTILTPQVPYAVVILPGQRGEITVYEATTATDRAAGMDKGASIAASTSIAIDAAEFRNNVSKVSTATGDIDIDAASFENVGRTLYERSTVKWGRGFTNNSKNKGVFSEGNGQEVLLSPVGYAYGTVNAGGKVTITAAHVNNGIAENSGVASSTSGSATTPGAPQGAIIAPPSPAANGQTLSDIDSLIGPLPVGGLFSVNTTPGHHYLVETNPALTSMASFYGSDYFLSRAGIDLDKTHQQLLGDAFYETRLVREQVFALTGRRLLSSSVTSDAEQMQALMDSALRAKSSLDLTIGVALSEAQLAQLTEDIVWLEKTVVDGHEVLAPKVYLASASLEKIAQGGSVIVGKDVALTTTGDASNTGVIQAANTLTINAANIFNTSGTLQGQTAALAATDSITNTSGLIKGGEVTLAAGKNIVSDTASITFASANTTSTVAGTRGRIEASGNLNMQAGESISLIGSDAAAGGSATVSAGKDVIVSAQQTSTSFATSQGSKYSASASVVDNQAATLTSGGALAVTAGQDLLVHGSTVQAGGNAALAAGGDLSITSATNTQEFSRSLQSKGGGLFGGKSSESASGSSSTNVASQVTAGGSLTAEAGKAGAGDLVVAGSTLSATQDVKLAAASNANILAAQMTSSSQHQSSSSGFGGLISSSGSKENRKVTTERSEIAAGGDISVEAQKDITLTAAKIISGGETQLVAKNGNVSLLTSKDSEYNRSVSSDVGWLTWSSQDKGKSAETIVNTLIATGKGLTITSRDGVTVEYKQSGDLRQDIQQLSQAQGLEWMGELLKRDDVNWKGVQEQYESWNKKDGGISPAATIVLAIAASAAAGVFAPEFAGMMLGIGKGASATMLALQSALAAGITATTANVTVAAANAAVGGDFGKNMEALVSEEGIRSLLASMVLAGEMSKFGSTFDTYPAVGKILATTTVKTITSNIIGGNDLEKAFLTSLGSSFSSYASGKITGAELNKAVSIILQGASGAAGAALAGGDPLEGALSSMAVEMAEWVKATPLSAAQKAEKEKYSAMDNCAYEAQCKSVTVGGEKYVKLDPGNLDALEDKSVAKLASEQLAKAGIDPDKLVNSETNLGISIYYKPANETGPVKAMGEVVIAVKGTEITSWKDMVTNVKQAFGYGGTQYDVATNTDNLKVLKDFADKNNCMIVATGHSLGGGVATAMASTNYIDEAIVFNPAAVNSNTIARAGGTGSDADNKTTAYVSRSDLLTNLQDLILNPAFGNKIYGTRITTDGAGLHGIEPFMAAKSVTP
jgi:filamentous hemagglutinin